MDCRCVNLCGNGQVDSEEACDWMSESLTCADDAICTTVCTCATQTTQAKWTFTVTISNHDFENEAVHIFVAGDSLGPDNKILKGGSISIQVTAGAGELVRFHAGRNGTVLSTHDCLVGQNQPTGATVTYEATPVKMTCSGNSWDEGQ